MMFANPALRHLAPLTAALVAVGCTQQMIRNESTAQLREARYEESVATLNDGLKRYPDSVTLRSGLVTTRAEATSRLIAQAAQERLDARFDEAEATLKRVIKLDPNNTRLPTLLSDLGQERRAATALSQARKQTADGNKDAALKTLSAALRDAPRHSGLVSLQRQLELERRLGGDDGRSALAESRPISLDFRNAPLSSLLEAITRGSGINFVLDRDVRLENRATIFIRSAKVEDAIDLVLSANQLARRIIDPQTILIYPNTPDKQREHQEQVIRVFHLAHSDAKSTAALLRSMLRIRDPFIDEKANLIALRESPDLIALAERLVALHDVGDAEVMLEVEILEIKTSRLTELGINFPNSFSLTPLAASGGTGLTVSSARDINSGRIGLSVGGLLVNLRREVGDFNTLANPRIRVRNKEKAKIMIGDKVPVITSNVTSSGFISENVNYLDVGLKLEVEPTVSPDDDVLIKLALEVSSVAGEVRTPSGSVAFQIGTRNATTVLRLRDGETQLLGGLISNDDRTSSNRVPGLGDLPIAGRLFSSQKDDYQRTELVLAITPRVIKPAARPDISQAELWVGTEQTLRLRQPPGAGANAQVVAGSSTVANRVTDAPGNPVINSPPTIATAMPAAPRSPANPTDFKLSLRGPTEVKVGDEFSVELQLATGASLRSAPLELLYPAKTVDVLAVNEGNFFKQSQASASFTHAVNTEAGRVGIGILSNEEAGVSGEGSLVQLKMRAKTPGPVEIRVNGIRPFAVSGMVNPGELPTLKLEAK